MATHEHFMAQALRLARRGWYSTPPNPRVGCVIVRDGQIIGEGWHAQVGGPHAEINALRDAQQRHGGARGAAVYVTLEPCCHQGRTPPCSRALIDAGVKTVYVGHQDPNTLVAGAGIAALRAADITVQAGVLRAACAALNPGFITRMTQARPRVRVKLAMSLDGRTAAANGESQWLTGAAARTDVHRLRAESGVVLAGIGTVLADDPSLNVRLPGEWRQPLRVVLDTALQLPPSAKMLALPGRTLVLTAQQAGADWNALAVAGASLRRVPRAGQRLNLHEVMRLLAQEQINDVLVESGPTLAGALVAAGVVDELIIYVAPSLIGVAGRGLFNLPGAQGLKDRIALDVQDIRAVGTDWRVTARPLLNNSTSWEGNVHRHN